MDKLTSRDIQHYALYPNGPFRGECYNPYISWLYTCPECETTRCCYCSSAIVKCSKCKVFRCSGCATKHLNDLVCIHK